MVLFDVLVVIITLAALIKGAGFLVEVAVCIARKLHVNGFIIGLSLVSIGTSIPEFASSLAASHYGNSGIVMGNILGSNIVNISLILGIGALTAAVGVKQKFLRENILILIAVSLLFLLLSFDGKIGLLEGVMLLVLFGGYLGYLYQHRKEAVQKQLTREGKKNGLILGAKFALGLLLLYLGARYLVPAAVQIAESLKVPEVLIGLTVIAIGTSLPELAVTITASRKRASGIMVGNLVGSNIVNIAWVIGAAALVNPLLFPLSSVLYLFLFMFLVTGILGWYVLSGRTLGRAVGIFLILLYAASVAVLYFA